MMAYDKAVCKHTHEAADMALRQCIKCNSYWATNAVGGSVITHYCPTCIPLLFHKTLADDILSVKWTQNLDAAVLRAEQAERARTEKYIEAMESEPDEPLTWQEQYQELRDLGYQDWQIAKRFGIDRNSLLRRLERDKAS